MSRFRTQADPTHPSSAHSAQKRLIALLALGAGSLSAVAQTSGGVTLYGLLDTTIRYSTHDDAADHGRTQMTDGVLTGSRWGVHGTDVKCSKDATQSPSENLVKSIS